MPGTLDIVRKQGAQEHFVGYKRAYLRAHSGEFQAAVEAKKQGPFYDSITTRFLFKFIGLCEGNFGDEPLEDPGVEDVEDDMDDMLRGATSSIDAALHIQRYDKLRPVSAFLSLCLETQH